MEYKIEGCPASNITLLYDQLPLEKINRNGLKRLLDDPKSVLMDTPETVVSIFPGRNLVAQFGNNRLVVVDQTNRDLAESLAPSLVLKGHKLVKGARLIAYGFNYDLLVQVAGESLSNLLSDLFLADRAKASAIFSGEIIGVRPAVVFTRGGTRYEWRIEILSDTTSAAHYNAHFQTGDLPSSSDLALSFQSEARAFVQLMENLLGKGA